MALTTDVQRADRASVKGKTKLNFQINKEGGSGNRVKRCVNESANVRKKNNNVKYFLTELGLFHVFSWLHRGYGCLKRKSQKRNALSSHPIR